jgi:hypothetical protein
MKRAFLCPVLAVFLVLPLASVSFSAEDLSGKWSMNSDGYKFTLTIQQSGSTFFQGTMEPLNHQGSVSHIEGTILPGDEVRGLTPEVVFQRKDANQHFHGFVFVGVEKGKHMAGTSGHTDDPRDHEGGWFAERQ